MTSHLVLRARIDLLRRNLGAVECVLTMIERHFPHGPTPMPEEIKIKLEAAKSKMRDVEVRIENGADEATMDVLAEAIRAIRHVQNALFPTFPAAARLVVPRENDFNDDLVNKAEKNVTKLDDLEKDIGTKPPPELWAAYHEIELDCRKLFNEYVDLVRGVALRSSGLDRDLCKIADELVRSVSKKWRSITIPARLETMASTSGRIIRIGFPEWTVWNVPLAVHEYGHVFADVVDELKELLAAESPLERTLQETLMADAFAALTVGPAYGCAVMLTRLDPGTPSRGGEAAQYALHRASMVIAALLAGDPPPEAAAMIERLRDEWAAAVNDTGYAGTPTTAHGREAEIIAAVHQQCVGRRFVYARWTDYVAPSAGRLLESARPDAEPATLDQSSDIDVRHLLNAGWLCRVPPLVDAERATSKPDELERIADQILAIGLEWLATDFGPPKAGGGQPSPEARSK